MGTFQTSYAEKPLIGVAGLIANSELSNVLSREVENSEGIAFGQPAYRGSADHGVVAGGAFAATGITSNDSNNTGAGSISGVVVTAGAIEGRYTMSLVKESTNFGEYLVEDPNGVTVGSGTIGTSFSGSGLAFIIIDDGADHDVGDLFYVDVSFTTNDDFIGISVMNPAVAADATTPDAYKQYVTGAFMTLGIIYVLSGGTVVAGGKVYWDASNKNYSAHDTHIEIPNAVFDTGGGDGDIVTIALKLR